ncbi:hypothetical protein R1sor_024773 [Riccia sorocarpa]|uniref:Uncharacterized protein n=1 Tax=Riccia sorocarpa TaxID=122646 RepID=A0ABD3GUG1_9MARC
MEDFIQSRLLEDRLERSRQEIERLVAEDQVHNVFLEQQFRIQLRRREQIQDLEIEQQVLQAQLMSLRPLSREEMEFTDFVRVLEQEGPPVAARAHAKGKRPVVELQQEVPQLTRLRQETLGVHKGETSRPAELQRATEEVPRFPDLPTKEAQESSPDIAVIPPAPAPPPQVIDLSPLGSRVASVSIREDEIQRVAPAPSPDSDILVLDEIPEGFPERPPRAGRQRSARQRRVLELIRERRAQEQVLEQVEDRVYYLAEDGVAYTRPELLRHGRVPPRRRMRGRVRRGGVWGGVSFGTLIGATSPMFGEPIWSAMANVTTH